MSASSNRTRHLLRKAWQLSNKNTENEMSFAQYKESIGWQSAIQHMWNEENGMKKPHEQRQ